MKLILLFILNPLLSSMQQAQPEEFKKELSARPEIQSLFVPPFHQRGSRPVPSGFCQSCHGPSPHRQSAKKRAFLNMHSRRIACETCHWHSNSARYAWDRQGAQPLIAPFVQGQSVWISEQLASQWLSQWRQADEAQKIILQAKIHQPLEKKGPDCRRCHTDKNSLLDWTALGYAADRVPALQHQPIARFLDQEDSSILLRELW